MANDLLLAKMILFAPLVFHQQCLRRWLRVCRSDNLVSVYCDAGCLACLPQGLVTGLCGLCTCHLARVGEAATFARCSQPGVVLASRALAEDPECPDCSGGRVIEASLVHARHPLASRTDQKEVKGPTLTSPQCVCT